MTKNNHQASFRDPSGFVFTENGKVRRVVHPPYFEQYDALVNASFYEQLIKSKLLIPHNEISRTDGQIILEPEQIPFITNPYEWSFEQYKHAALLTLKIHKLALDKGFILKDASAYNVTFHKGRPIFIDTLSFDFYEEGSPWRAYKQFIMHFFGPLLLAKYHGADMLKMMQLHIDGIPVKTLSSLLPFHTKLSPTLYTNVHLLAKMETKYSEDYKAEQRITKLSKKAQYNIVDNLYDFINTLQLREQTEWGNYYDKTNYSEAAFLHKSSLIKAWATELDAKRVIDIGGNDGTFGRALYGVADQVLVSDIDPNAVAHNYKKALKNKEHQMLTFVCDVLQPAPAIGFSNTERSSLLQRLSEYEPDLTMGLALIHHITLSGNVLFDKSAAFFAQFSKYLILEFPKREDTWVTSLLARKREFINHFAFYNQENFETAYQHHFSIEKKELLPDSHRIMYLLKRKE